MNHKNLVLANRILLGLIFVVAGVMKITNSEGVVGMLTGNVLFSWAPAFWAWVLILSEIVFGIAILAGWRLKYTVWPPVIIMIVAAFTVYWGNWSSFLMHLAIASNLLLLPKTK